VNSGKLNRIQRPRWAPDVGTAVRARSRPRSEKFIDFFFEVSPGVSPISKVAVDHMVTDDDSVAIAVHRHRGHPPR